MISSVINASVSFCAAHICETYVFSLKYFPFFACMGLFDRSHFIGLFDQRNYDPTDQHCSYTNQGYKKNEKRDIMSSAVLYHFYMIKLVPAIDYACDVRRNQPRPVRYH